MIQNEEQRHKEKEGQDIPKHKIAVRFQESPFRLGQGEFSLESPGIKIFFLRLFINYH